MNVASAVGLVMSAWCFSRDRIAPSWPIVARFSSPSTGGLHHAQLGEIGGQPEGHRREVP